MTTCNGCGACCDPVILAMPYTVLLRYAKNCTDPKEEVWIREALRPMAREEAYAVEPWLRNGGVVTVPGVEMPPNFYRCKYFDRETRTCTAYEARPDVCRIYPWPDGVPVEGAALPPTCSFNVDIGRPVADASRRRPDGLQVR